MASQNDFSNKPIDELAAMRLRFEKQDATFSKSPAPQETIYTEPMNSPTREEFEAKLETIEARMDTRVATMAGKIDVLVSSLEGREQSLVERDKRIELIAQSAQKAAEQAASLKSGMWLAAISIIASVILASAGFYLAIQANTLSVAQMVTATFQAAQTPSPMTDRPAAPPPTQKK